MCTVAFIPYKESYFFASLRDESPSRPAALAPVYNRKRLLHSLSPVDPLAGGTWMGANQLGHTIVLLNGGFISHQKQAHQVVSRGLIVSELLHEHHPVDAWLQRNLSLVQPFTLIVFANKKLYELVWTGHEKHHRLLNHHQPFIWSSSTLYNANAKEKRSAAFYEWLKEQPSVSAQAILNFFTSALSQDSMNGFIVNRASSIQTLSFTCIHLQPNKEINMRYDDFRSNTSTHHLLLLQKEKVLNHE